MQFKTFRISISSPERSEGELNAFLRVHRVLTVERQLVNDGHGAYWAALVEYAEDVLADAKIRLIPIIGR